MWISKDSLVFDFVLVVVESIVPKPNHWLKPLLFDKVINIESNTTIASLMVLLRLYLSFSLTLICKACIIHNIISLFILHFRMCFYQLYLILDSVELKKHGFYFNIIVLSKVDDLALELSYFSILSLLTFNKNDRMVERFFLQMILVIFP